MKQCPVQPLYDRIVVDLIANELTTESGIVIPDAASEKPTQGIVLAVGTGKIKDDGSLRPLSVKIGDQVMFSKHAGQSHKINDTEYHIIREEEIVAVIRPSIKS